MTTKQNSPMILTHCARRYSGPPSTIGLAATMKSGKALNHHNRDGIVYQYVRLDVIPIAYFVADSLDEPRSWEAEDTQAMFLCHIRRLDHHRGMAL